MKQQADIMASWRLPSAGNAAETPSGTEPTQPGMPPSTHLWDQDEKSILDFDLGRLYRALLIRKWLILIISGVIFSVIASAVLSIPPTYRATAQILIDPADSVVEIQSVSSPLSTSNQDIASEMEVIRSNHLARQLIDAVDFRAYSEAPIPRSKLDTALGLDPGVAERGRQFLKSMRGWFSSETEEARLAEDAALRSYYDTLSVWRVLPTFVISVAFDTLDPDFSARAANELAAIYIANQIEQKKEARLQASELLTANLSKLEDRIQGSKNVVDAYREESGLSQSMSTELLGQQLSEQMSQLVEARAIEQAALAQSEEVVRLARNDQYEELISLIGSSSSVTTQWDALREAERDLISSSQDYGPNHPIIVQRREDLLVLSERFNREIQSAVQTKRIEANVASQKVAELERSTLELRQSMTELAEKEDELSQLEADAEISKTLRETLTNRIREAESAIVEGPDARILNLAQAPIVPESISKKLLLLGAFFGAFMFSGTVALALEFLSGGYQSEEELRTSLGWPILATVPKRSGFGLFGKRESQTKGSAYTEAFNALYTNLEFHGVEHETEQATTILITSSIPGEGKSTAAHGLASAAADNGARVLVIDADLRRATLHEKFDIENTYGLSSCDPRYFDEKLAKKIIVANVARGIDVIPAGEIQTNPQNLLRSEVLEHIISANRPDYDMIIIDTPPILAVADAQLVSKHCDSAVLVIKWASTSRRLVQRAINRVAMRGMPLTGCVLTQVPKTAHRVGTYQYLDYS